MASRKSARPPKASQPQPPDDPEDFGLDIGGEADVELIERFLTPHNPAAMTRSLFSGIAHDRTLSETERIQQMLSAREKIGPALLAHRLELLASMDFPTANALFNRLGGNHAQFFSPPETSPRPESTLLDLVRFRIHQFYAAIADAEENEIRSAFAAAEERSGAPTPTLPAALLPTLRWAVGKEWKRASILNLRRTYERWRCYRKALSLWDGGLSRTLRGQAEVNEIFRDRELAIASDASLSDDNRQIQLAHLEQARRDAAERVREATEMKAFLENPFETQPPESCTSEVEQIMAHLDENGFQERQQLHGLINGFFRFWHRASEARFFLKNERRQKAGKEIQRKTERQRLVTLVESFLSHLGKTRLTSAVLEAIESFSCPAALKMRPPRARSILHTLVKHRRDPVSCSGLLETDHFKFTPEEIQPILIPLLKRVSDQA